MAPPHNNHENNFQPVFVLDSSSLYNLFLSACYQLRAELAVLAAVEIVDTHNIYIRLHKDDFREGPGKLLNGTIYRIFDILRICITESQYQS